MQAALAPRGDSHTYFTHFVGPGLDDDRYVVQRYLSRANGYIVAVDDNGARPKGRRRARPEILSLEAVEELRPARNEIIVATGVNRRDCGCQLWGWRAMGIFVERRQKS